MQWSPIKEVISLGPLRVTFGAIIFAVVVGVFSSSIRERLQRPVCYLVLDAQVLNGFASGLKVNPTNKPTDNVEIQIVEVAYGVPDNTSTPLLWEKNIDCGTCRARMMEGISTTRFPIDGDRVQFEIFIPTREETFRENISFIKHSAGEYSEHGDVFRGASNSPYLSFDMLVPIMNSPEIPK